MDVVEKTYQAIKNYKILGAENIAIAAIVTWDKAKDKKVVSRKLSNVRPTEPMLRNVLKYLAKYNNPRELLINLKLDKKRLAKIGARKIKDGMTIFTHCHSSSVIAVLKQAKLQGKKFKVYNTETRPLYQGRITAKELAKLKIPVTLFIDSAARVALKDTDMMLIGADAITAKGEIINKIGSEMYAEIAKNYGVKVYSCTHSWKFDPATLFGFEEKIEKIRKRYIWKRVPKGVKVNTYIFEKIRPELIDGIICEIGIIKPEEFVKVMKKRNEWMFE